VVNRIDDAGIARERDRGDAREIRRSRRSVGRFIDSRGIGALHLLQSSSSSSSSSEEEEEGASRRE